MKKTTLVLIYLLCYSFAFAQLDDTGSTSNGSMILGTGTGTLYQFAGDQRGSDGTNQSQGGFGILSGANQISPIVWMYGYGGKNAFQVRKKGYNSTVQNGTTLFHVGVNGNVGIGTDQPSEKLTVSGNAIFSSEYNHLMWPINSNHPYGGGITGDDGQYKRLTLYHGHSIAFETGSNIKNHSNTRLYINANGNVGIGTTTPNSKLAVKGKIHCEEVKVDLSVPGPDYVFEEDYDLRSLEDIKAYIQANKHLPEVPSAKEMEKNGVDLSEMNMLLLKKIEELTLHNIKQNERIEKLEKLIEER